MSGVYYGNLRISPAVDSGELRLFNESEGTMTGVFSGEYKIFRSGRVSLRLRNCTFNTASQTIAIPGRIPCRIKSTDLIPEPEQVYRLRGKLQFSTGQRYPGFSATTIEHVSNRSPLHEVGGKLQRKLRDGLNTVLPTRHATVVGGLLLGDTSQIRVEDRALFRETGVSHLLAVSGQHLMVLSMVIAAILHLVRVPPVSRSILISAFLIVYAFATSGSPSIVRALIMYISVAFVLHFESAPSSIRPLSIAALLILFYDPSQVAEPSFILSFSAVAGIVLLRPMFEDYLQRLHLPLILARYLAVTFAANLAVIPFSSYLFGGFSVVAMLVNPAIIWVFSIILPASFIIGAVSAVSGSTGLFLAPGLSLPLDGLLSFLEWARSMPGGFYQTGTVPGFMVSLAYGTLLLWAGLWNRRLILSHSLKAEPVRIVISSEKSNEESEIRTPTAKTPHESSRYTAGPERQAPGINRESANVFKDGAAIRNIDGYLLSCRRRSLKGFNQSFDQDLDLQMLSIENQNLYHQLVDLDRQVLVNEEFRLIQAQIFLLALAGSELLGRISAHLYPEPDPAEFSLDLVVKDRYLAVAILGDRLLSSSLLTRTGSQNLLLILSRGQTLFSRGRGQLQRMLKQNDEEILEQHFSLRRDLLAWCREFIEYDIEWRRRLQSQQ
ncbi:MAG: ComEC/Rec2 family competence protein [Candidatus Rifleibacteriota bacterium]